MDRRAAAQTGQFHEVRAGLTAAYGVPFTLAYGQRRVRTCDQRAAPYAAPRHASELGFLANARQKRPLWGRNPNAPQKPQRNILWRADLRL